MGTFGEDCRNALQIRANSGVSEQVLKRVETGSHVVVQTGEQMGELVSPCAESLPR
jgi:hypothetical protein